jgi:hypothetical protein
MFSFFLIYTENKYYVKVTQPETTNFNTVQPPTVKIELHPGVTAIQAGLQEVGNLR